MHSLDWRPTFRNNGARLRSKTLFDWKTFRQRMYSTPPERRGSAVGCRHCASHSNYRSHCSVCHFYLSCHQYGACTKTSMQTGTETSCSTLWEQQAKSTFSGCLGDGSIPHPSVLLRQGLSQLHLSGAHNLLNLKRHTRGKGTL